MHTVFLSAGHGGKDPGAVAYNLKEKDINLQVLLACKEELEKHNVKVVCSRVKDENDPKEEEVREANASGATVALSIHTNAARGDGFEAYCLTTDSEAKELAKLCEKHIKAIGQNSRGIKSGNKLYFCKNTKMTNCLVENFFVDNDTDNDIGDTVKEQRAFGVAYAKAILEYLDSKTVSVAPAKAFSRSLSKTYYTTHDLNLRYGAGTVNGIVTVIPKGKKVRCYGYYTPVVGVKWYLVTYGEYTGFVSSRYLK